MLGGYHGIIHIEVVCVPIGLQDVVRYVLH